MHSLQFHLISKSYNNLCNRDNDGVLEISGMFPAMLKRMCREMNLTLVSEYPPDGIWGSHMENGTWTGIIGVLSRSQADISPTGLTITPDRVKVVDFTSFTFFGGLNYIMSKEHLRSNDMWIHLSTLTDAFLVLSTVAYGAMTLYLVLISSLGLGTKGDLSKLEWNGFWDSLGYILVVMGQRSMQIDDSWLPTRFLIFTLSTTKI